MASQVREHAPSLREHLARAKAARAKLNAGVQNVVSNEPPKPATDPEFLNQMYHANARAALVRLREKRIHEEFKHHWIDNVVSLHPLLNPQELEEKKKAEFEQWLRTQRKKLPRKPIKLGLPTQQPVADPTRPRLPKTPLPSKSPTPPGSKRGPTTPPGSKRGPASPPGSKGKGKGKGKSGEKAAAELEERPLMTSIELLMQAQELLDKAAERDAFAGTRKGATFERRLGTQLIKEMSGGKKLEDLVREWDKNGDGDINQIEFRACVRNNLCMKADNKEIDAFFSQMDKDGGGALDLSEIRPALKALKDASTNADKEIDEIRAQAQELRVKADVVKACAESVALVEKAETLVTVLQSEPSAETEPPVELVARRKALADAIDEHKRAWVDASITKSEVRRNIKDLGVIGEEIETLLDKKQKVMHKQIIDKTATALLVKETAKALMEQRKAAKQNQKALLAERAREKAEAEAKAEAEEARLQAEAEAKEEKKRLRAEAKKAEAARKAAEKAEYEAKIAARRAAEKAEQDLKSNKAMITEDVDVQARREAQKSIDPETGTFNAKKQWKMAGLLAKLSTAASKSTSE